MTGALDELPLNGEKPAKPAKVTTDVIRVLLRKRYGGEGWAFIEEVRNAAGFNANRSLDAMAMGTWPSRGLHLHGFEIKSARNDWLRELEAPEKAEAFARYCDRFWLVTGPRVAEPHEVPDGWGWLEADARRLTCRREAPKMDPEPLPRTLLAAILKRNDDAVARHVETETAQRTAALRESLDKARDEARQHRPGPGNRALEELQQIVADFEAASGVRLRAFAWQAGNIGEAIRRQLNGVDAERRLQGLAKSARRVADDLEAVSATLDTAPNRG